MPLRYSPGDPLRQPRPLLVDEPRFDNHRCQYGSSIAALSALLHKTHRIELRDCEAVQQFEPRLFVGDREILGDLNSGLNQLFEQRYSVDSWRRFYQVHLLCSVWALCQAERRDDNVKKRTLKL